jgi:hypothetical protein
MKTLRTATGLMLAIAIALIAAAPAAAEEEVVVPPENSAVNQYTEAFPTAGGDRDADKHRGRKAKPAKVIGSKNAKRLDEQGADGRATAELAAETAPNVIVEETSTDDGEEEGTAAPAGNGGGTSGGGGPGSEPAGNGGAQGQTPGPSVDSGTSAQVDGSSGLSEVLSRAIGSPSGGGMGLFLPLLILATIVWALIYTTRQRRPAS